MEFSGPIYIHTFEGNKGKRGIEALRDRARMRKMCGPYRITPFVRTRENARTGIGFYQSSHGLSMGDGIIDLRLVLANDAFEGYSRLAQINGYYCDEYQDQTMMPIVARLPRSRGFLAGWTMGEGMCASLDGNIYPDLQSAAHAAHSIAENDAEKEREYEARENERIEREEQEAAEREQAENDAWELANQDAEANS